MKYVKHLLCHAIYASLPLRECGLKLYCEVECQFRASVTPFAGVWIEMSLCSLDARHWTVTPFAGVWIEIVGTTVPILKASSHSLCGSVD